MALDAIYDFFYFNLPDYFESFFPIADDDYEQEALTNVLSSSSSLPNNNNLNNPNNNYKSSSSLSLQQFYFINKFLLFIIFPNLYLLAFSFNIVIPNFKYYYKLHYFLIFFIFLISLLFTFKKLRNYKKYQLFDMKEISTEKMKRLDLEMVDHPALLYNVELLRNKSRDSFFTKIWRWLTCQAASRNTSTMSATARPQRPSRSPSRSPQQQRPLLEPTIHPILPPRSKLNQEQQQAQQLQQKDKDKITIDKRHILEFKIWEYSLFGKLIISYLNPIYILFLFFLQNLNDIKLKSIFILFLFLNNFLIFKLFHSFEQSIQKKQFLFENVYNKEVQFQNLLNEKRKLAEREYFLNLDENYNPNVVEMNPFQQRR